MMSVVQPGGWRRGAVTMGVVLAALGLSVLPACGSRVKGDAASTSATRGPTTSTTQPGRLARIGTLPNPCGPGPGGPDIRIGTISDRKNPTVPVPTVGVEEGARAFVAMCNDSGGINGRKLNLTTYDSEIFRNEDVTKQACNDDLLALVGDGSVQDQQGITTRQDCGLTEVAAYAATKDRAYSQDFFQPIPYPPQGSLNVAACKHLAEQYPEEVKHAAIVFTSLPASADRAKDVVAGCEQVGFRFVVQQGLNFGEKNMTPLALELKDKGVRYLTMIGVVPDTLALLREVRNQDYEIDVVSLEEQYYDPALAADKAAEGVLVQTATAPFAEVDSTPALAVYERYLKQVKGQESALGVRAFSAGLLFATAAKAAGSNLDRATLLEQLRAIDRWDGGGIQAPVSFDATSKTACVQLLRVKDKAFVREWPKKGFGCVSNAIIPA